jgi:hypothetical protein
VKAKDAAKTAAKTAFKDALKGADEEALTALSSPQSFLTAAHNFEFNPQCTEEQRTELNEFMKKHTGLHMLSCCNIPAGSEPPEQCKLIENLLPQCVCPN